ncbi:MAG: ABC transporter, partial [Bdellovibrionales bacterium]|nr:ABC transporter [Bdellovibrionales bacterium]
MTRAQTHHPLVRLFRFAHGERQAIRLGIVCSIINRIFDLAPPVLIGAAVDVVVSRQDSFFASLGVTDVVNQLWLLAGLTLLIWGLESLFEYFASLLWRNAAQG